MFVKGDIVMVDSAGSMHHGERGTVTYAEHGTGIKTGVYVVKLKTGSTCFFGDELRMAA